MAHRKHCKICGNVGHDRRRCEEEKYFSQQWHCPICWAMHKRDERTVRNSGLRAAKYHNETLGKHRIFQCPTLIQRKLNGAKQLLEISKFITNAIKDGIGVGSLYQSVGFDDNITVMLTSPLGHDSRMVPCVHRNLYNR